MYGFFSIFSCRRGQRRSATCAEVQPVDVTAYIEHLPIAAPSVK